MNRSTAGVTLGTEFGFDWGWKHCDITWDKSLGGHRWKLVPEEEMERDSMHEKL